MKIWVLIACYGCLTAAGHAGTEPHKIIILITLDGFPAYAINDDRLPTPTLRSLASQGVIADGMSTVNPTVTWPNHTTLVTGVGPARHFVLFNGKVMHHGPDKPVTVNEFPRATDVVKAKTLYDLAAEKGLVTAQVAWPATAGATNVRWSFDATPDPDGEIARDLIAHGICARDQLQHFGGTDTWRDEIYTDAAIDILEYHTPDLLLLHLSASDMVQHEYGPRGLAAATAYAFEDDRLKQIVEAVRKLNLLDRTIFVICSDHGFRVVHHQINLNALLLQQGWAESRESTTARAWTIAHGGVAMAYISNPTKRAELIPKLRAMLSSAEGVDHIYSSEAFAELGLPSQDQTDQSPDLFITAKIDYFFDEQATGSAVQVVNTSGEHGYLTDDPDMNALFVASGAGIRSGVRLGIVRNIDVAPTIARLLGLSSQAMDGKVLTQVLVPNQ